MKTKDKNEYSYSDEVKSENNVENNLDERQLVWTKVIIGMVAFTILFFSFFYFFEGEPYKIVDSRTTNICESSNPNDYADIKAELAKIIEDNGYTQEKIYFEYFPESDSDPEEIYVFFKKPDGTWYYFKDNMTLKWKLPNSLRKKIREL